MRNPRFFHLLVVPLTVFAMMFFLSFSTAHAASLSNHNHTVFSLPHGSIIASGQFQVPIKSDGTAHPDIAICAYTLVIPFRSTVNGQDSITAEGGFSCNAIFTVATLYVVLDGPTVGTYIGYNIFQCALSSVCFGSYSIPYQAGGVWQTEAEAVSSFAAIPLFKDSGYVSL